jgi:hypothetical protein
MRLGPILMGPLLMGLILGMLAVGVNAQTCTIVASDRTTIGASAAITGTCSNSGGTINCHREERGSWSCTGPSGTYWDIGSSLNDVIASACGCPMSRTEGQTLERELAR